MELPNQNAKEQWQSASDRINSPKQLPMETRKRLPPLKKQR